MSDSTFPAGSSLLTASALAGAPDRYALSSELAKLCLPGEFKETHRRLAWVDSICFLFLVIGIVGLKAPRIVVKPLSQVTDVQAEIFVPPPDQQKIEPAVKLDEPQEPQDTPLDTPQVVTVVAVKDSSAVGFAVPVQGTVAVAASPAAATPPPRTTETAPKPTFFNRNTTDGGSYPPPQYPAFAQRNSYQGTAVIEMTVDTAGNVTSAKVRKTSGFALLDEAALSVVQRRWRFPPGPPRYYYWECTFHME